MINSEISRLEKEADLLDDKLTNMSLKERAEWDKHYPFSITTFDTV